ncbi:MULTISPECIES: prepilin peptidase-dependent protein [Atlantibacter]|uniref:prepilin peptidase-dependent protein n=1 Tax=Atlantibacter TaxID=1903434 RepID=UPI00193406A0|nr:MULTISPECIES: prepilin peptidase-dependent protein [Atlantibacter]MBL7633794.1 prepilin peptidase-dependent protein [Atlantibacter hermannii]MBL7676813.1 prepilin peptidase-dependent protein [Atlantibacter hermannii]
MLASRGFSLIEVLVAMSLSSILMIGTMRLLPSLQRAVLQQSQLNLMREDVWQLAFGIAKQAQRAGYCHGECPGKGMEILDDGHCLIVQWDANHNGKWDGATTSEPEQTGYRLRERNIEIQRGATQCTGKGWERLTDPGQFRIDDFTVAKIDRAGQKPLITISLSAAMAQDPTRSLNVLQQIVGYNQ